MQRATTVVFHTPPWGNPPLYIKGAFYRIPGGIPDYGKPFALELHPPDGYQYRGVIQESGQR
jgi:hypothetical protein